jgi:hypothetical protein
MQNLRFPLDGPLYCNWKNQNLHHFLLHRI